MSPGHVAESSVKKPRLKSTMQTNYIQYSESILNYGFSDAKKKIKLVFFSDENFNYLGSILNADNKINIETAERIAKGAKHTMTMRN
jgi:hypothetical protein